MDPKDMKTAYSDPEDDFSLEEILEEYGAGRQQKILRDVEEAVAPKPAEPAEEEAPPEPPKVEEELPPPPKPITLEEVVGSTVDAVMEEQEETRRQEQRASLLQAGRSLFSRRRVKKEDTGEVYEEPEYEPEYESEPEPEPEFEPEEERIGRELPLADAAADYRAEYKSRHGMLPAAIAVGLLPTLLLLAERWGLVIPYWSGDAKLQSLVLLLWLAGLLLLCRGVIEKAEESLIQKHCTGEVLILASVALSALDCLSRLILPGRTDTVPYAAVSGMALVFAQWGVSRESRGWYDTFRSAAVDEEPPYLVTETANGACKQRGTAHGFYTTAMRDDSTVRQQTIALPLILVASLVFAGLSSLGKGRGADFFLSWSAILAGGAAFSLPLAWSLPFSKLAQHWQKSGAAVAGWSGAERISRKRSMIVTDTDLFPPGTVHLNGVKVFGEDLKKAISYAASLTALSGSGLTRLFEDLRRSEGCQHEPVDEFSFYEEGGWAGVIHGESVLLGTASFLRKMEVRLPENVNLKTGIFLAIDRRAAAVFAVKYDASENVDFALAIMRRSHITPILASRDPNITPALLKRKFHSSVRVEYPNLTTRMALSEIEQEQGLPRVLLFREGLLPYAETIAGSRRLCGAAQRANLLALLAGISGTLLVFYLVGGGNYALLSPLTLELFQLLWTLPVLLVSDWAGRY